jgi:hypothetical protein
VYRPARITEEEERWLHDLIDMGHKIGYYGYNHKNVLEFM